jgi:regulator of protease activity HflC (stomatin/prohibitin superfamily)
VQEITIELQKLKNLSEVTLAAQARQRAAEIHAAGEGEAVRILQETQNDLLYQKVQLMAQAGDLGKIALFVQQHLCHLFAAYQEHAKGLGVDNLLVMDDERGFNGVVNRGPEALVDFLSHFEKGFGIRVKDLLTVSASSDSSATSGSTEEGVR